VAKFTRESLSGIKQHVRALWTYDHGRVGPPAPRTKRRQLLGLFREGRHDVIVESGTYLGGTVAFFVPHASRIVSVEIDPALHARAQQRFSADPNVDLRLGDALEVVPSVIAELDRPCLLWLDGHFSGGITGRGDVDEPAAEILRRLGTIAPPGTTIVVDDLRSFGRDPDAPSLDELLSSARAAFPESRITTGVDCLIVRT
jgi:hypothetical protein